MGASYSRWRRTARPVPALIWPSPTDRWTASISRTMSIIGLVSFLRLASLVSIAALALASGELGGEGVEALGPEPPELVEPFVDRPDWLGIDRVDPAGA